MAQLGIRKFDDLIGRADLLDMKKGIEHWKAKGLDFSRIFHMPQMPAEVARFHCETQDHGLEKALDNRLIELAQPALERGEKVTIDMPIRNINRTVGTMLSHEIAKRYGHEGLPEDTIHVRFAGSAGQSFGAFLARGVTLDLIGDTNDYCGKGLSGGRISVQPSPKFRGEPTENIITGNVVLYGAIAGEAYFRGVAGERFAVRNSGATAVVEGVGDHGCEYMTGGTVVVLGQTGRNFAAGMSGGIAYVLDADGDFVKRCNTAMVDLEPVLGRSRAAGKLRARVLASRRDRRGDPAAPDREPCEAHGQQARAADPRAVGEPGAAASSRCSRRSTGARSASLPRHTRRRRHRWARSPDSSSTSGCRKRAKTRKRARSTTASSSCTCPTRKRRSRARAAWTAARRSACPAARSTTSSRTGTTWCTARTGRRRSRRCTRPTIFPSSPGASARRRARKPACCASTRTRSASSRSSTRSSTGPGKRAGSRRSRRRARPARRSR